MLFWKRNSLLEAENKVLLCIKSIDFIEFSFVQNYSTRFSCMGNMYQSLIDHSIKYLAIQGVSLKNLILQMAVALSKSISDPMLLRSILVWGVAVAFDKISFCKNKKKYQVSVKVITYY